MSRGPARRALSAISRAGDRKDAAREAACGDALEQPYDGEGQRRCAKCGSANIYYKFTSSANQPNPASARTIQPARAIVLLRRMFAR